MTVKEYLTRVDLIYDSNGNVAGQRSALNTATGKRIRKRMADDLAKGAVVPPVVIGVVLSPIEFESVNSELNEFTGSQPLSAFLRQLELAIADKRKVSIIDGMQRTTAFKELGAVMDDCDLRVEFWITKDVSNLTYRMLVLNTGQVPWNLRRQIEVVFEPLISSIENRFSDSYGESSLRIVRVDESTSRTHGGIYHAHNILECYLAFALKKDKIDNQELLTDEFAKLDMIDAQSDSNFIEDFNLAMKSMVDLDVALSNVELNSITLPAGARITNGKALFGSQPARIGFFTSAALYFYGVTGDQRERAKTVRKIENFQSRCRAVIDGLHATSSREEFLKLDVLNQKLSTRPVSRIGDSERSFYKNAYRCLFEEDFSVQNLGPLWENGL